MRAKVKKKLDTAEKSIGDTETRTRAMQRRLREVEVMPADSATAILNLTSVDDEDAEEETDSVTDD